MRREPVERLFDQLLVADGGWAGGQAVEPGRTLTVVGEQGVDVCSEHAAIARHRALRRTVLKPRKRSRAIGAAGDAHMHLVAAKRNLAGRGAADRFKPLATGENGFDVEQTKA